MAVNVWLLNAASGSPSYTGKSVRQTMGALMAGATATRPLGARSGVRQGTPNNTVSVSGGNWTCGPHSGVIDLQASDAAGPYMYAVDAATTPAAIPAAHSSWGRIDLVWVRVDDQPEDGGAPTGVIGYTAGTASATPSTTAAVAPARCMPLAQINVPNATTGGGAASATVTPVWTYSAAAGGTISVRNQAERDLITWGAAESPATVWRADLFRHERNAGGGWRVMTPAGAIYTGATDVNGLLLMDHGLGYAPSRISVAIAGTGLGSGSDTISILADPVVWSVDSTYLGVRIARRDTSTWYTSTTVAVAWTAA